MRLVDHDQIVVAPIHSIEGDAEGLPGGAGEVGVAEDVVVEPVLGKNISGQVRIVVPPVVRKLFGAENENRAVPQLIIFDHRQGGECFAETDRVRENTPIVGLELIDDARGGVLLVVEEFVPDHALLVACQIVRKDVFIDLIEEVVEDVVEHHEVDALGGILLIDGLDVLANGSGDVLHFVRVRPDLIEELKVHLCVCRIIETGHEVRDGITLLVPEIDCREAAYRHVGHFAFRPGDMQELLHRRFGRVGPEPGLFADPVSALTGDSALSELVAQLDLEFRAVEAAFAAGLWNEELPTFLPEAVGHLGRHKRRSGEDELQAVDLRKLGFQGFERVDREARRRDPQTRPAPNRSL